MAAFISTMLLRANSTSLLTDGLARVGEDVGTDEATSDALRLTSLMGLHTRMLVACAGPDSSGQLL